MALMYSYLYNLMILTENQSLKTYLKRTICFGSIQTYLYYHKSWNIMFVMFQLYTLEIAFRPRNRVYSLPGSCLFTSGSSTLVRSLLHSLTNDGCWFCGNVNQRKSTVFYIFPIPLILYFTMLIEHYFLYITIYSL